MTLFTIHSGDDDKASTYLLFWYCRGIIGGIHSIYCLLFSEGCSHSGCSVDPHLYHSFKFIPLWFQMPFPLQITISLIGSDTVRSYISSTYDVWYHYMADDLWYYLLPLDDAIGSQPYLMTTVIIRYTIRYDTTISDSTLPFYLTSDSDYSILCWPIYSILHLTHRYSPSFLHFHRSILEYIQLSTITFYHSFHWCSWWG